MADDIAAVVERLRTAGWSVACHNDYRLNGEAHTFWLFTRGDSAIKGEGRTDAEALAQVEIAAARLAEPPADMVETVAANAFRDICELDGVYPDDEAEVVTVNWSDFWCIIERHFAGRILPPGCVAVRADYKAACDELLASAATLILVENPGEAEALEMQRVCRRVIMERTRAQEAGDGE